MTQQKRPFLDVLADLRRRRFHAEATDSFHELVQKVQDTGKKGSIVITLTLDPKKVGDFDTPQIEITDSVVVKAPRRTVAPSMFYVADDGNVSRTDPNQEAFEGISAVPEPTSTADRKAN